MNTMFDTIHNHQERAVLDAVIAAAADYQHVNDAEFLADVACVALNRLPPRYIRHDVDYAFYLTERERAQNEAAISEAVAFAVEFVQAKVAMRARR